MYGAREAIWLALLQATQRVVVERHLALSRYLYLYLYRRRRRQAYSACTCQGLHHHHQQRIRVQSIAKKNWIPHVWMNLQYRG